MGIGGGFFLHRIDITLVWIWGVIWSGGGKGASFFINVKSLS